MTIVVVLAAWVMLSPPLGLLIGTLCGHQRRYAPPLAQPPTSPGPRVPVQVGSAA